MNARDEFYVGYLPAPAALVTRLRALALGILILAGPAGILIARAHTPTHGGSYEYGTLTTVRGELELTPLPALRVMEGSAVHRVPLVAQGKHGVTGLATMDGRPVTMQVTRIHRGHDAMFEVTGLPAPDTSAAPLPPAVLTALGAVVVTGEIVDGKCDLGVMNPGDGPLHRACAVRCLSGGVPPMLLMRDRAGREARVALAGSTAPLPGDLVRQWAGAAVEVRGTLVRRDDEPLLLVSPDGIRRLP